MMFLKRCMLICLFGYIGCTHATTSSKNIIESDTKQAETASDKFLNLSNTLEKLGADETLDKQHVIDLLQDILATDKNYLPAKFDLAILQNANQLKKLGNHAENFTPLQENITADSLMQGGSIEDAVVVYQKIITHNPKNKTSRLALARIYLIQKRYQEAIVLCRDVLQWQADAIEAFRILAASYIALNHLSMGELVIGRGLKIAPHDIELHMLTADIFVKQDKVGAAVQILKKIIEEWPNAVLVRLKLADIALQYRDFSQAVIQYEFILKNNIDLLSGDVVIANIKQNLIAASKSMPLDKK